MALSVRCDSTISAFSPDMPIERSRQPVASIARVGNRLFNPPMTCPSSLCSFCGAAFGARQFAQPLRHGLQALGVAQDVRHEILLLHPRQLVGLALQRIQQQLGGALDRGQRRFQFMGEMRRERRDVVRPPRQLLGHVEEAVRQLGDFAGAVMRQRLKGVAIAAADARGAIDQLAHRPGNGAREDQTDDDRRAE